MKTYKEIRDLFADTETRDCPACHGTGDGEYIDYDDGHAGGFPHYHKCHTCKGRGWIEVG